MMAAGSPRKADRSRAMQDWPPRPSQSKPGARCGRRSSKWPTVISPRWLSWGLAVLAVCAPCSLAASLTRSSITPTSPPWSSHQTATPASAPHPASERRHRDWRAHQADLGSAPARGCREAAGVAEELRPGEEVAIGEEALPHALAPGASQPSGKVGGLEQSDDRGSERVEIVGIVHEQAVVAVADLFAVAAHTGGDHGSRLPQRFRDAEAKAFLNALLDDDVGESLQRIDHRRILVERVERQAREVDVAALLCGKPLPCGPDFVEGLVAFRIVLDGAGFGPGNDEVRTADRGQHVLGEGRDDAYLVLEPVPARERQDDRIDPGAGGRSRAKDLRSAVDADYRAVGAEKVRRMRRLATENPHLLSDRSCQLGWERLILERRRIDRRRDDADPGCSGDRWDERRPGEHERIRASNLRKEPFPRAFDALVWSIGADVATPYHPGPSAFERRDERRGLRVVQDNGVAGSNASDQRIRLGRGDTAQKRELVGAKRAAVPEAAVEPVVQPLGDAKELVRARDDDPADVDSGAAPVGQQRAHHRGDASAGSR